MLTYVGHLENRYVVSDNVVSCPMCIYWYLLLGKETHATYMRLPYLTPHLFISDADTVFPRDTKSFYSRLLRSLS